jgi:hypothetical protein
MKYLTLTRDVAVSAMLRNMDRFLVPLLILAALVLGGTVFSYATIP